MLSNIESMFALIMLHIISLVFTVVSLRRNELRATWGELDTFGEMFLYKVP